MAEHRPARAQLWGAGLPVTNFTRSGHQPTMAAAAEGAYLGRRNAIPVIYARGTHYEVGYDVGRTFGALIHSLLEKAGPLNDEYLPLWSGVPGRRVYDDTLAACREAYPQYVAEIQGTADGAGVPFHKLFLLQMDDIITNVAGSISVNNKPTGCSSICLNEPGNEILGHTEDTLSEILNHFYILSAHIVPDGANGKEERFTSLCYAGHLPGYTMGFNHHGLVYSINTISAKTLYSGKIPRTLLTRALLAADNLASVEKVLTSEGRGAADACSINLTFLHQEGARLFHNIELGPGQTSGQLDIFTASPGEFIMHCNRYLRLKIPEVMGDMMKSSDERMDSLKKHGKPLKKKDIVNMLSDQTGESHKVFMETGPDDYVKTIAVGIFDCCAETWSLYSDKPNCNEPLVVLPLLTKKK